MFHDGKPETLPHFQTHNKPFLNFPLKYHYDNINPLTWTDPKSDTSIHIFAFSFYFKNITSNNKTDIQNSHFMEYLSIVVYYPL